jgi:dipeptidyl aminopeptidase/acylaminoacyl peptidase
LVDKITKPILLFHGKDDKRVTLEHSYRMKQILDLANKESELIILANEGHSLNNPESEIVYIARSLNFIKKQLGLEK